MGSHSGDIYDAHAAYLPGGGLSRGSRPAGRAEDGGRDDAAGGGWLGGSRSTRGPDEVVEQVQIHVRKA